MSPGAAGLYYVSAVASGVIWLVEPESAFQLSNLSGADLVAATSGMAGMAVVCPDFAEQG